MQIAVAAASKSDVNPAYYNQHPREIRRAHKLIGTSKVSPLPDLKFQCQGRATTCRTSLKRIFKANYRNGGHIRSCCEMQIPCIDHGILVPSELRRGFVQRGLYETGPLFFIQRQGGGALNAFHPIRKGVIKEGVWLFSNQKARRCPPPDNNTGAPNIPK